VRAALRHMFDGEGNELDRRLNEFEKLRFGPEIFSAETPGYVFEEEFVLGVIRAREFLSGQIKEFETYASLSDGLLSSSGVASATGGSSPLSREIFVVHGHDDGMRETVARFLETKNFTAIILHEKASGGDTLIEKFERHSGVGYAVVLFSPDDYGAAMGSPTKSRARQNVIFELGFFMGKLGRGRVCVLIKDDVEEPSDIDGIVYIDFDTRGAWKLDLVKELEHVGFTV